MSTIETIDVGDLLYKLTLSITEMKEYGVSFAALTAGKVMPPVEGARFDVAFEGTATGPKLNGAAEGTDYVRVPANGRFELHIHETIMSEDGQNIAHGDGVAILRPEGGIADLRVNMKLFASSKEYLPTGDPGASAGCVVIRRHLARLGRSRACKFFG